MTFTDINAFADHLRENDEKTDKYQIQEKEFDSVEEFIEFVSDCIQSPNYEIYVSYLYDDETWRTTCSVGFKILL